MEELYQTQPRLDQALIHQRRRQVLRQQPGACARDRSIHRAQQAARARAAHRRADLQAFPGGRVDRHMGAARLAHGGRQKGQGALARMIEIGDKPAHRGQLRPAELAESVEGSHTEQPLEC